VNSGMYYYGYRFYDPNLQRWINRDPMHEAGGFNLYRTVDNCPIGKFDPDGRDVRKGIDALWDYPPPPPPRPSPYYPRPDSPAPFAELHWDTTTGRWENDGGIKTDDGEIADLFGLAALAR